MLTGKVYNIDEVLKNLDKAEAEIIKNLYRGVQLAAFATESHIKKDYNRAKTGKGFTDRTGTLRRSVGSATVYQRIKKRVMGFIFAGGASAPYAVWVEFRWGGKYAYLWPGITDMKNKIWQIILDETRRSFK